jgi:hypothetical protein
MRKPINRLHVYERSRRYHYLLTLIAISWTLIALVILFIDPDNLKDIPFPNSYLPMGTLLFLGFFFFLSLIFLSSKRAFLWSIILILFLYLRLYGIASLLTGIFLLGFLLSLEFYLKHNSPKKI